MKVYHYTSQDGVKGILQDKIIYQSNDQVKDCLLGLGVYLTRKSPGSHSKMEIGRNNYGSPNKANQGYVDFAIQFEIPDHELKSNGDGRDIWCYQGRNLKINNYSYKVIEVSTGKQVEDENASWCNLM